ncbi:MAG: HAMP domain-containing histidine kinase [Bacteroidota bacterium]|nr:HAMP domain-containing histidine kinase [Bacteroidota bacterium]
MKLLTKYSLVNLIIMVAIFIVSSLLLYKFSQLILIREMNADLTGVQKKVQEYVKQHNAFPVGFPLDEEEVSYVSTGSHEITRTSELTRMFSQRENKMHNFMKLDFPLWFNKNWYKITIAKPIEGMHHLSRALITISISTLLLIILIWILLNSILLKRLWSPFYESMDIMRNFKLGETGSLVFPKTSTNEFSFMNGNLLLATEKAKQDYLLLKEFTENASHEMQTPLSIIRSKLDMMIQEEELSQKQSELAKEAYSSIKKLSGLNKSLLLLAKIENQQFDNKEKMNLTKKVEEKIEQFRELWQGSNIIITSVLHESTCFINPELLDILLNNLFSNASNHNIPGGFININLAKNKLMVSNSGSPTPLDETKLFTRFYKTPVNSNRNGLGLSIIKQIAKASGIDAVYQYTENTHSFIVSF